MVDYAVANAPYAIFYYYAIYYYAIYYYAIFYYYAIATSATQYWFSQALPIAPDILFSALQLETAVARWGYPGRYLNLGDKPVGVN